MRKGMESFVRGCVCNAKSVGRDRGFLFWAAAYPLILAVIFNLAFSGMLEGEFEKVPVGISEQNSRMYILEEIDLFELSVMTKEEAKTALQEKKISGFIDDDFSLLVLESGGQQTLIKEVMDHIRQVYAMDLPYDRFHFDKSYIQREQQKEEGASVIFYSMIGMVALYGIYSGISFVQMFQGNLSPVGARIQTTPLRRNRMILSAFATCTLMNLLCNLILLLFMRYVLDLRLFHDIPRSLMLIATGNLLGTALGIFISASNKMAENAKDLLAVGLTLFLSFTSGMNGVSFKLWIRDHFPFFSLFNPVTLMTDTLYRVNLLSDVQGYQKVILVLCAQTAVLLGLSYIFLRREQYDSL